jgi:hypothetical protein
MVLGGGIAGEGRTLGAGRVLCDVSDLTLYFGTNADPYAFASRPGEPYLPVDGHVLKWEYQLHTGNRKGLAPVALRGPDIAFSVESVAKDPGEQALLGEFLSGLPSVGVERSLLHQYARLWLPRFYASRYLLDVYMATGQLLDSLDFDEIFDGVWRAGAPPGRRAAGPSATRRALQCGGRRSGQTRAPAPCPTRRATS